MTRETLEIKVSAKTHCNDLAGSIVAAWGDRKDIILSCIGPVPISQAYKATCVANRALASRGVVLVIIPGLVMKDMPSLDEPGKTVQWVVAKMRLKDLLGPITSENTHGFAEDPLLEKGTKV
jgi:stage V sporulation protein SpoVS